MKQEEARKIAEEVACNILGYDVPDKFSDAGRQIMNVLLKADKDAREDERERCAKVADKWRRVPLSEHTADQIAKSIRDLKEKE